MSLAFLSVVIFLLSLAALYFNSLHGKDAPYVPMETDVVSKVLDLAKVSKKDVFYDLGSGDGRLVIAAARRGAKSTGIEIEPFKVFLSKLKISKAAIKNAQIIKGDVYKQDLSDATVISLYLLPRSHKKLKTKFKKELKKGTRVVASGFEIKGWKYKKYISKGTKYGGLYLYEM